MIPRHSPAPAPAVPAAATATGPDGTDDARWSSLMMAVQDGDRTAYETLLRACIPLVERVARRQGVRGALVDDVVQESLLTLHRARHTYDPARPFAAWLTTIAQRRAIDALRRDGRRGHHEVHDPLAYEAHPAPDGDPAGRRDGEQQRRLLAEAVRALPERQHEAVEHLALRGLSLDEAAAATGRNKGALKVNLHRALKALGARFGAGERQA